MFVERSCCFIGVVEEFLSSEVVRLLHVDDGGLQTRFALWGGILFRVIRLLRAVCFAGFSIVFGFHLFVLWGGFGTRLGGLFLGEGFDLKGLFVLGLRLFGFDLLVVFDFDFSFRFIIVVVVFPVILPVILSVVPVATTGVGLVGGTVGIATITSPLVGVVVVDVVVVVVVVVVGIVLTVGVSLRI